jgi:hypothetical protein
MRAVNDVRLDLCPLLNIKLLDENQDFGDDGTDIVAERKKRRKTKRKAKEAEPMIHADINDFNTDSMPTLNPDNTL